jgi:hypothetical protein
MRLGWIVHRYVTLLKDSIWRTSGRPSDGDDILTDFFPFSERNLLEVENIFMDPKDRVH